MQRCGLAAVSWTCYLLKKASDLCTAALASVSKSELISHDSCVSTNYATASFGTYVEQLLAASRPLL